MFDIAELKNAVIDVGNTPHGNFLRIDDYGRAVQAFRNAAALGRGNFRINNEEDRL